MSDFYINRASIRGTDRLAILARTCFAALCLLLALYLLHDRFQGLDLGATLNQVASVPLPMVLLGIFLTAVSYLGISGYDLLAFRLIGRDLPARLLLRSGLTATALGQTLGFGVVVGGIARWRMLRSEGVTPSEAAAASALVASGFFLGLMVVFAVMTLLASASVAAIIGLPRPTVVAASLLALTLYGLILSLGGLEVSLLGRRIALPNRTDMLRQTGLAALDVIPAGLALWVFLPSGLEIEIGLILTAYVAALAAGLLANTPGGLGAFEGVFLIALPQLPMESLLAGILCFRLFYYGLPFCIGALLLTQVELRSDRYRRGRRHGPAAQRQGSRNSEGRSLASPAVTSAAAFDTYGAEDAALIARAVETSDRAEANLAFLGDKRFLVASEAPGFVMFGRSGRTLVALGDPVAPRSAWPALIAGLKDHAGNIGARTPVFYKVGPETAAICRAQGLRTIRIGHEAVLDLATFDLTGSHRRELRRKTRQAAKAGVEILRHAPGAAPLDALAEVARLWRAAKQGRERSFSTGHFDPVYLARFPIFEAQQAGRTCAFISLWISGDGSEWALDVMRTRSDVPSGTMHTLVTEAALAARAAGARRFNLCMAPLSGLEDSDGRLERLGNAIYLHGRRFHGLQGLRQFKSTFRPEWEPRYLAHRTGPSVIGAAFATYRLCRKMPGTAAPIAPTPAQDA